MCGKLVPNTVVCRPQPGGTVVWVTHAVHHGGAWCGVYHNVRHAMPNWERRGVVWVPQAPWCGTNATNETTNHRRQKFDGRQGGPLLGSLRVLFFLPRNEFTFWEPPFTEYERVGLRMVPTLGSLVLKLRGQTFLAQELVAFLGSS